MNQRERFLALGVGGLVVIIALQWAFTKYRTAVNARTNQVTSLQMQKQQLEETVLQGAYADRQMGEYLTRSLSSVPERAQSDYQRWLLDLVQTSRLSDANVDPASSVPVGDLYQRLSFRVTGNTNLEQLTELLHGFYAKDYLHRIRELVVNPTKNGELRLTMSIDALALKAAAPDVTPPPEPSWRVSGDSVAYREQILNRNFFAPPNEAPRFAGSKEVEAIVGAATRTELKFEDPEGQPVQYTLLGEAPEFATLDPKSGTLTVEAPATGRYDLVVQATDAGRPQRSVEQALTVTVKDPPEPPQPKPEFDDATQTVLTGLVQGRDDWTAWMNVRTRGETLKLRVGDSFEIGSLKGDVVEVTQRYAVLEIDGRRFTLRPSGNLAEAAKMAEED